ncbi:hypothetical protein ACVWWR_004405 [Bradyrhizobium sp. LM3.2]
MIPISPADLPRADHSRHWYSRGDSTTPPTMRSIVQKRFACSWKNVAINRRLWSVLDKRALESSSTLVTCKAQRGDCALVIVDRECKPAANAKFVGFFEQSAFRLRPISRFKSKPPSEGLRLAHCPTYHRIDGFVAALQIDGGPGGGICRDQVGSTARLTGKSEICEARQFERSGDLSHALLSCVWMRAFGQSFSKPLKNPIHL